MYGLDGFLENERERERERKRVLRFRRPFFLLCAKLDNEENRSIDMFCPRQATEQKKAFVLSKAAAGRTHLPSFVSMSLCRYAKRL